MGETAQINYCRHCGRGVATTHDKCMYCGGRLRRGADTKPCPFCAERVRADALKCRYCGEFIDGRETPAAEAAARPASAPPAGGAGYVGPTNVQIFVIDRALVNAGHDIQVPGGAALPVDLAQRLPRDTVRAIETNRPDLLPAGRVRALPPPQADGPEMVDVQARPVDEPAGPAPPVYALPAPEPAGPLSRKELALRIAREVGKWTLWALHKLAVYLWAFTKWVAIETRHGWIGYRERQAERKRAAFEAKAAEEAKRERALAAGDCPYCSVEVHPMDLFCYHCGHRIGKGLAPFDRAGRSPRGAWGSQWARLALVFGVLGFVPVPVLGFPVAVVAILCGIAGVVRVYRTRPRMKGRNAAVAGILLGLLWLAAIHHVRSGQGQLPIVSRFWGPAQAAVEEVAPEGPGGG